MALIISRRNTCGPRCQWRYTQVIATATEISPSIVKPAVRHDMPALTGLRFFLALWVILHHLTGPGQALGTTLSGALPAPLFTLIRGGYQAVTTFFVLSGFVLTRSYWSA